MHHSSVSASVNTTSARSPTMKGRQTSHAVASNIATGILGLKSDRRAYWSACEASDRIPRSQADLIREELVAVLGDIGSTGAGHSQPHTACKSVNDDADCAQLVSTFCQFFVDKVGKIQAKITSALQLMTRCHFPTRYHVGPTLGSFQPVLGDDERHLFYTMRHVSHPCSTSYRARC